MSTPKWDDTTPIEDVPKWEDTTPHEEASSEDGIGRTAKDFGLGALQGASFGFADEAQGALQALGDAATEDVGGLKGMYDRYTKHRDDARDMYKDAEERSPYASFAGNMAGGLIAPGIGMAKGAVSAGQLAKAGLMGGALYGAGASEANPLEGQTGELIGDVATGGLIGGVTPLALKGVAAGAKAVVKRIPAVHDAYRALAYSLQGNPSTGLDKFNEFGKEGRDLSGRVVDVLEKIGKSKAEEQTNLINNSPVRFDMRDLPKRIREIAAELQLKIDNFPEDDANALLKMADKLDHGGKVADLEQKLADIQKRYGVRVEKRGINEETKAAVKETKQASKELLNTEYNALKERQAKELAALEADASLNTAQNQDALRLKHLREKHSFLKNASEDKLDLQGKHRQETADLLDNELNPELEALRQKQGGEKTDLSLDHGNELSEINAAQQQEAAMTQQQIEQAAADKKKAIIQQIEQQKATAAKDVNNMTSEDVAAQMEAKNSKLDDIALRDQQEIEAQLAEAKATQDKKLTELGDQSLSQTNEHKKWLAGLEGLSKTGAQTELKSEAGSEAIGKLRKELTEGIYHEVPELGDINQTIAKFNDKLEQAGFEKIRKEGVDSYAAEGMKDKIFSYFEALEGRTGRKFKVEDKLKIIQDALNEGKSAEGQGLLEALRNKSDQFDIAKKSIEPKLSGLAIQAAGEAGTALREVGQNAKNTLANITKKSFAALKESTPQNLQEMAAHIAQKATPAARKLSNVFSQMADKSPNARKALMFGVMQNPEYRQLIGIEEDK